MPVRYITSSFLKEWSEELGTERTRIVETAAARAPAHATFLSHSSKDQDILPAVIKVLQNHGAKVYIDKKDPSLPPYTSRKTAAALRSRIESSKKFVMLASQNSKDSRWVPWELGLADGYKQPRNVAIFPSVDSATETQWTTWEYLGIYDRIVFGDHKDYKEKVWMVLNQESWTATELGQWLAK